MSTYRAIPHFYDDEYADLEMLQEDVGLFLKSLPRRRADVLMLACGTGRAAIPVALAGHRVLGVDLDARMIELARQKRDFSGLSARALDLEFGDILKWKTSRRFDVVSILFNSFLLFTTRETQDQVLQRCHAHLKRGGRLWIDIFNPDLARIADDEAWNADVRLFFSRELNCAVQRVTHIFATGVSQVRETVFEYTWFDEKQKRRSAKVRFELTYLFPRELESLLLRNGFEVERLMGDYDGGGMKAESPRIIVQARKR